MTRFYRLSLTHTHIARELVGNKDKRMRPHAVIGNSFAMDVVKTFAEILGRHDRRSDEARIEDLVGIGAIVSTIDVNNVIVIVQNVTVQEIDLIGKGDLWKAVRLTFINDARALDKANSPELSRCCSLAPMDPDLA